MYSVSRKQFVTSVERIDQDMGRKFSNSNRKGGVASGAASGKEVGHRSPMSWASWAARTTGQKGNSLQEVKKATLAATVDEATLAATGKMAAEASEKIAAEAREKIAVTPESALAVNKMQTELFTLFMDNLDKGFIAQPAPIRAGC